MEYRTLIYVGWSCESLRTSMRSDLRATQRERLTQTPCVDK